MGITNDTEKPFIVWTDIETTGLSPTEDAIIEIALSVAAFDDPFNAEAIYHAVIGFGDWKHVHHDVLAMHSKSGLVVESLASKVAIVEVEHDLLEIVPEARSREHRPILAGSTVHFDRSFFRQHMPKFEALFAHRHFDVSSMKLLAESQGMPRIPKADAHRALPDIGESISHGRRVVEWFRTNLT